MKLQGNMKCIHDLANIYVEVTTEHHDDNYIASINKKKSIRFNH